MYTEADATGATVRRAVRQNAHGDPDHDARAPQATAVPPAKRAGGGRPRRLAERAASARAGRPRPVRRIGSRLRAVLAADPAGVRQGLVALLVASAGSFLAGLTLGAITDTLEELPGLLVLVPAAIGMRGNVFGALGSRLGTTIHAGTFRLSWRRDTVVGQNVLAAISLSLFISLVLALLAKAVAIAFHLPDTIPVGDFVLISVTGGALSSLVVLGVTLLVAVAAARFGWDMDNVAAPLVTAAGDMVTLPALWFASHLVGRAGTSDLLTAATVAVSIGALLATVRTRLPVLARIMRESVPVLVVAGLVDVVAGLTIEQRLESFVAFPALLVLIPPFLEDTGALGGVLSSRLSTKLHLGVIEPTSVPARPARDDFVLTLLYAVPVFTVVAVSADLAAVATGLASPGLARMVAAALIGGLIATTCALAVAYYGGIAAFRLGLDPDNHGIPLVTSSMDLIGTVSLLFALVLIGVI